MTDRLSHLKLALDLGFQLGQGKKVDLREMADKHLTKECPRCEGHRVVEVERDRLDPEDEPAGTLVTVLIDCPNCKGTGRVPA